MIGGNNGSTGLGIGQLDWMDFTMERTTSVGMKVLGLSLWKDL